MFLKDLLKQSWIPLGFKCIMTFKHRYSYSGDEGLGIEKSQYDMRTRRPQKKYNSHIGSDFTDAF